MRADSRLFRRLLFAKRVIRVVLDFDLHSETRVSPVFCLFRLFLLLPLLLLLLLLLELEVLLGNQIG